MYSSARGFDILSELVNVAYVGSGSCTLAAFIKVHVKRDLCQVESRASNFYAQFLDALFVAYPTEIDQDGLPGLRHLNPPDVTHSAADTLYSEVLQDSTSPDEVGASATVHPVLDRANWDLLYEHIGSRWIGYLATYCSLFVVTPCHSLWHFHDGPGGVARNLDVLKIKTAAKRKGSPDADLPAAKRGPAANAAAPAPPKYHEEEDDDYWIDLGPPSNKRVLGPSLKKPALDLPWSKLLYNKNSYVGFLWKEFTEMSQTLDDTSEVKFAKLIFGEDFDAIPVEANDYDNTPRVFHLLRSFLANHYRCHFGMMVDAHCGEADADPVAPCSPQQVGRLLSAVIHRVVPTRLLGSKHNERKLSEYMQALVRISLGSRPTAYGLLSSFRVGDCWWLPPDATLATKRRLAFRFLRWFICDYLLSAFLPGFFYVTEREGERRHKKLHYYLKARFLSMQTTFVEEIVSSGVYAQIVDNEEIERVVNSNGASTLATVRLIPKLASMRPVVKVRRTATCKEKRKIRFAFEDQLRMLQSVAQLEQYRGRGLFGGNSAFVSRWRELASQYQPRIDNNYNKRSLFFVKFDIKRCFESMLLKRVTAIIEQIMADPSVPNIWCRRSYKTLKFGANQQPRTTFQRVVLPGPKGLLDHVLSRGGRNCLVFKERASTSLSKTILNTVVTHLNNFVLRMNRRYFRVVQGVGQGDKLSAILCSLYYGDLERNELHNFGGRSEELFVRYTDDYLFVTPYRARATRLLDIVLAGVPRYNFSVNPKKTTTTFNHISEDVNLPTVKRLARSKPFVWNGFCLNTRSLEVSLDYRAFAGQSIGDRLAMDTSAGVRGLSEQMHRFCNVRRTSLVFDGSVNGQRQLVVNLYQHALMNALRFHFMVLQLPTNIGPLVDPASYAEIVRRCLARVRGALLNDAEASGRRFCLRSPEIGWIWLQAFLLKLRIHSDRYRRVVPSLEQLEAGFRIKVGNRKRERWENMLGVGHMPVVFQQIADGNRW